MLRGERKATVAFQRWKTPQNKKQCKCCFSSFTLQGFTCLRAAAYSKCQYYYVGPVVIMHIYAHVSTAMYMQSKHASISWLSVYHKQATCINHTAQSLPSQTSHSHKPMEQYDSNSHFLSDYEAAASAMMGASGEARNVKRVGVPAMNEAEMRLIRSLLLCFSLRPRKHQNDLLLLRCSQKLFNVSYFGQRSLFPDFTYHSHRV